MARSIVITVESLSTESNHNQQVPYEEWVTRAVCKGLTDIFYDKNTERIEARLRREDRARQICHACPVIQQCLEYSIEHNEFGFWGGQSEVERFQHVRKKRIYNRPNSL